MSIVVAISGASGIVYGKRMLEALHEMGRKADVVITDGARRTARLEKVELPKEDGREVYGAMDFRARFASGSASADVMIVCPCSMKTLSAIANGYADNLLTRSADVVMKEGGKLVLVLREMPLSAIHLENALKLARLGVVIMPASPGFYGKPKSVGAMVDFVVGRALKAAGIENKLYEKWMGGK
ncbi:MAG: UbiX family flavin prenyltransferase [Candidatus Burarchaeum sp.]|nr:UbiX family flavin prenyltransferase [Candidatus Burarchaeum sp.]MDO8339681.1 UbiX family flavin prenyltransferase [Candidatus Burarchaeum sp.]